MASHTRKGTLDMEPENIEDMAKMFASVLTEEELNALTEWLEEIRNGKWESKIDTSENPSSMNG